MTSTLSTTSKKSKKATIGFRGFFNRRRDECNSLIEFRLVTSSFPLPYPSATEPEDDDTDSISSHSTNSTVDDNPGTGRLIDKHIYQKFGRKLERIIFWIKLPSPSPAQIYGFFEKMHPHFDGFRRTWLYGIGMDWCIRKFRRTKHGKSSIYGLKCLVKQTQSSSLHQSAAALISLMRVAMLDEKAADFYICISKLEPIFQVETLVISNNDSSLRKSCTLLLVKLAKAHTIVNEVHHGPHGILPMKSPSDLRQDFLCLLKSLPSKHNTNGLFESVADACNIYAHAVSRIFEEVIIDIAETVHVAETMHLMIVFFIRSILTLHTQISSVKDHKIQQFARMVLSALSEWLDYSIIGVMWMTRHMWDSDNKLLENRIAFYGLVNILPCAKIMLPQSFQAVSEVPHVLHLKSPRNRLYRDRCQHMRFCRSRFTRVKPLLRLVWQSSPIRILVSIGYLEQVVKDGTTLRVVPTRKKGGRGIEYKLGKMEKKGVYRQHKYTCCEALRVRENEDELTEEFEIAQKCFDDFYQYKTYCRWRSVWAQFFLSNLDWDWDRVQDRVQDRVRSPEKLYALDESTPIPPAHTQQPETHIASIDAEGAVGQTWDMKTRTTQQRADLPKEIRIPYASETSDIKYMVFVRDADVAGDSNEGRTSLSDYNDESKEQGSVGTAEVDMCAGEIGPSGTQYFMGDIAGVEGDDATPASETPSDSKSSLDSQECYSVSWSAQDIDGRPVLPCVEEESECEAFIVELASETEGEGTTLGTSAKSTQVSRKRSDPSTSISQYISFTTEAPHNQAFIEELDNEKGGDKGTTTSKISNELVKVPSNEIDSASAFTGQTRFAFVGQTGMKWFQMVGVVCASIFLERLIIAMLGHIFGMGGNKV